MKQNIMPASPTKDAVVQQIKTIAVDLPPPNIKRWVSRRKALIVYAVRSGAISLAEACRRYEPSVEEFLGWRRAIDVHGVAGLRVTRLQIYRVSPPALLARRPTERPCGGNR